ncbi:MAG: Gfo/Idh/MocA family oxidoreductase [Clostridia bacterium]|nr:Gfo/Idh/MocA family oxidoreductase [Clostridia bacterium]
MEKIRIGVIGNGMIGNQHLQNYQKIQNAEVVALCDIDEKALHQTGDRFNIKDRYTNIFELLARDDVMAVDVCLHNNLHAPVTIAALKAGKDVYCEKPMAGSYADAKAMYQAMLDTGRRLHIQIGTLYEPETKAARRLIQQGRLGRLYHLRSYGWRRRNRPYVDGYGTKEFVSKEVAGGGALFDMGVYHIAQLLYLSDLPTLQRVVGATYAELSMNETRRQISQFDVEELGCGFATYENNLTMDVLESWAVHMGEFPGSMLMGDKGGIQLNPFRFYFTLDDLEMDAEIDLKGMEFRNHTVFSEQAVYDSSQVHWIAALMGQCELLPTARIALETQLLQEGIYLAEQLGREVTADEIEAMSQSRALEVPNLYPDSRG